VVIGKNIVRISLAALLCCGLQPQRADALELDGNNDGKLDDIYISSTITRDSELSAGLAGKQNYSEVLDIYASITPSANAQSILAAADYAAMRTLLTAQLYDADLQTAAGADAAGNSTYFGKNSGGTVGFHAFPTGSLLQGYDADLATAAGANAASASTYFGKDSGGTVGFHSLPTVSAPAWLPSSGPTADNQIIQSTGVGTSAWTSIIDGLINDAGTGTDDLLSASEINTRIATSAATKQAADADLTKDALEFVFGGTGTAIAAGGTVRLVAPWNATITGVEAYCTPSGSISWDVQKATGANFPTLASIVASTPPTVSSSTKLTANPMTGWTTTVAEGEVFDAIVGASPSGPTLCTLKLQVAK
jgi:hypothetical protein